MIQIVAGGNNVPLDEDVRQTFRMDRLGIPFFFLTDKIWVKSFFNNKTAHPIVRAVAM